MTDNITNNDEPRKPWYSGDKWVATKVNGESDLVWRVSRPNGDAELGTWLIAGDVRWGQNARLISASPDLLEALQSIIIGYKPRCGSDQRALDACHAAIAKALG